MSVRVGDEIVAGGQGDMYTKAQVDALIASAIAQTTEKPGMIKPFAGTTVPTGYLLCDGSAVSRTTYANLFSAIGTTYGSGDGSTTFNLPNTAWRALFGVPTSSVGGSTTGELPNITGYIASDINGTGWLSFFSGGCFYGEGTVTNAGRVTSVSQMQSGKYQYVKLEARISKSAYSRNDNTVVPQSLYVLFMIKY